MADIGDTFGAVEGLLADGRLVEADELAQAALSTPAANPEAGSLRLIRASIGLLRGRPLDALHEAEEAGRARDVRADLFGAASAYRLAALSALHDLPRARELAEAILAGREAAGNDEALASAVNEIGLLAWEEGRLAEALGLLRAAAHRSPGRSEIQALHSFHPRLNLAPVLVAAGDLDGARAAVADANRELHPTDHPLWRPGLALLAARVDLAAGSLDAAVGEAERALRLAERFGAHVFVPRAAWVLASAALLRGDMDEAAARAATYRDRTGLGCDGWSSGLFRWADARLAQAQGRDDAVEGLLADVVRRPDDFRLLFLEQPASAAWLVRVALRSDEPSEAEAVVASAERVAATNPGYASVRAVAEHARGVFEQDAAVLTSAAQAHAQPWARASAHEDAASALAEHDRDGAVGQLREALITYRDAGADWDVGRVTRRIRRAHRQPHLAPPGSGWGALTEMERRVAHWVAHGLSNPEVGRRLAISRHTVDFHLRQIFRKLGIGSRVALARIVGERAARKRPRH